MERSRSGCIGAMKNHSNRSGKPAADRSTIKREIAWLERENVRLVDNVKSGMQLAHRTIRAIGDINRDTVAADRMTRWLDGTVSDLGVPLSGARCHGVRLPAIQRGGASLPSLDLQRDALRSRRRRYKFAIDVIATVLEDGNTRICDFMDPV